MGGQVWREGRGGEGRDYRCFFHATICCELNPRLQTLSSRIAVIQTLVSLKCSVQAVPEAQNKRPLHFFLMVKGWDCF